jgi:hypothetical protein
VIYAVLFVSVQRRWEKREIRQKFGEENSCKVFTWMVSKKMDIKNTQKVNDAEDSWKWHFFFISMTPGYILNVFFDRTLVSLVGGREHRSWYLFVCVGQVHSFDCPRYLWGWQTARIVCRPICWL